MVDQKSIPAKFLERMATHLGEEFDEFEDALAEPAVSGLRVNVLKLSLEEFKRITPLPMGERVSWAPCAVLLQKTEISAGSHPHHLAGLYYLQDPSAMSPAELANPKPGERILDLAASPGGKTTHLAALMQGKGVLVANEIKNIRVGHLAMNVERWGASNVVVTNETPERLADTLGTYFDCVLVDAPCSGEGMFRKDMGARADWSEEMVTGCAIRQKNILRVAANLVSPGGRLLYSTCTFAAEENEGVILSFLGEHPHFEVRNIGNYPGFMSGQPEWVDRKNYKAEVLESVRGAVRLFPHRLKGEGHFVCLMLRNDNPNQRKIENKTRRPSANDLRKTSQTESMYWRAFWEEVLEVPFNEERLACRGERLYYLPEEMPSTCSLRVVHPGLWLGNFKKNRFEPAHPLALFLKTKDAKRNIDLPADAPLLAAYLRGETFDTEGKSGWTLISVDGYGLGWGKAVQGVMKNHYPRGWISASYVPVHS